MSKTKTSVRYGVTASDTYSEENPYIDRILTPQEAVAEMRQLQAEYPDRKVRIFKRERTDVTTDVTNELV